ncbi:MAG: hypothetical protein RIR00_1120 [Pseudomonadota bacterium]|jgi:HD-like signal output (HDOD) protein
MDNLSLQQLDKVFASIEIPACPAIVQQVMGEAQKDEPDLKALSRRIASDVGMAAMTIKLANSPLFRSGNPATSVPQAVARLGTRNVVCVVIAIALRNAVPGLPAAQLEHFWNRATAIANAAGVIARRQHGIAADAAYTFALFHDAAIPVLLRRFSEYGALLDAVKQEGLVLCQEEMRRFHCDHMLVGGLLAKNWGLPPAMAQAIRHHHDPELFRLPPQAISAEALSLVAVTLVAEELLARIEGSENDVEPELFLAACQHLGIGAEELHELEEELVVALRE